MRRLPWLWLVLACTWPACGSDEAPINQVGVNVVEKAIFQDSWYMSRTVVDVGYEASGLGTFPGDIASDQAMDFTALPRIRWVIDENTLFAYRDYPLVQGGDGQSKAGKAGEEAEERAKKYASPVAAYKIEKHFDIRRNYNPSTGEERNVVEENDTDRRWYDRKFMRVDWSKNLLPGYFGQTANLYELLGNYTREPTDLYIQDSSRFPKSYRPQFHRMSCTGRDDKDCPDYERDRAGDYDKDELYHMSFVSQETLSPGLVPDPETGEPVNWCAAKLYSDAPTCSSIVSYVRTSFLKVSEKRQKQYEPVNYVDDRFERFGYFRLAAPTVDRSNGDPSDPSFGMTDFLNYNANRHNIWQTWRDKNDKPIPYEERDVRQIVWYTTPELPAHLVQPSYDLVSQWNESFMATVRQLRNQKLPQYAEMECQKDDPDGYCFCESGAPARCPGQYDPFKKPDSYPSGTTDPYDCYVEVPKEATKIDLNNPALKDADFNAWYGAKFVGDECVTVLRTNTCNRASLAEAGDKKGELECQERGDLRFKFLSYVDQPGTGFLGIATLRGDPVTGEIIAGDANIGGPALDSFRTSALQTYDLIAGNLSDLEFQVGEDVRGYFENLGRVSLPARPRTNFTADLRLPDAAARQEIENRMQSAMTRINKLQGPAGRQQIFADRLKKFVGTDLERRLVAGLDEQAPQSSLPGAGPSSLTEAQLNERSPLRNSLQDRMAKLHDRELRLGRSNVTMPNEYADDSVQWFVSKHADWPRARLEFALNRLLYRQTELHELGHCFGLRHDFGASADSEHYRPDYYAIADKYPLPDPSDFDKDGGGMSESEQRAYETAYADARSKREVAGIDGAMSSSVMEYTANWYERLQPLGRYDRAAIAFGYGDLVEAYDGQPSGTAPRQMLHFYQGGELCETDADCPYSASGARADNLMDANMSSGITQRCVQNPRVSSAKMCSSSDDDLKASADQGGKLKPLRYRFCTDERADSTLAWCNRFDEGANYRDIVRNIEESYDRMYIFSAFRRYRAKWSASSYVDALLGRRLNILQTLYQNLAYQYANDPGFRKQEGAFGFYDQFLATTDILNFYARILAQPSVGSYRFQPQTSTYELWSYTQNVPNTQLSLPLGIGRYFWSDYQAGLTGIERLERVGTFFDKARVIELLAERGTSPNYTRDVAFFSNFYDLFPNEMQQIFTGMIRGYPQAYMPRIVCEGGGVVGSSGCGKPRLVYMDFYRGDCSKKDTCLPNPAETTYAKLPVVDGGGSLTLQIYAALYGLAYFPVYFDTTFQNQLFVCIEGQADCFEPAKEAKENEDFVRYTSPRYRRTFVAFQVEPKEGVGEQTSIGFAMVKEAYELDIALSALRKMQNGPEPNSVNNLSPDDLMKVKQIGYTLPTTPTDIANEATRVNGRIVDLESFLNQMIEIQRQSGIQGISYFVN
ncbi:MAG TPA: hypothetical protein VJV78_06365 [Polyangiales bacterium]|nr:hypothetical protein [Polyangiales bacterium]